MKTLKKKKRSRVRLVLAVRPEDTVAIVCTVQTQHVLMHWELQSAQETSECSSGNQHWRWMKIGIHARFKITFRRSKHVETSDRETASPPPLSVFCWVMLTTTLSCFASRHRFHHHHHHRRRCCCPLWGGHSTPLSSPPVVMTTEGVWLSVNSATVPPTAHQGSFIQREVVTVQFHPDLCCLVHNEPVTEPVWRFEHANCWHLPKLLLELLFTLFLYK